MCVGVCVCMYMYMYVYISLGEIQGPSSLETQIHHIQHTTYNKQDCKKKKEVSRNTINKIRIKILYTRQ